jgi:nucleoside-diphosphate-sugar epimerase
LKPSQILITGNMGYVGPAVVRCLRASRPSATLVGLDAGYFAHCLTGAAAFPERDLDVQLFLDLRHANGDVLRDIDTVVHLAGISNDALGNAFENATHQINFEASVRFAQLAKEAGVKSFVFASSCSVYGFAEGAPRAEDDELNPLTAYARSKWAMEKELENLASEGFVTTCLRFPTACGMSERLRLDLVLNDFVASAVATGRIDIQSSGMMWRPLIDTRDMALAIDWAVSRDADVGGISLVVNVGRNEANFQLGDLAAEVVKCMPGVQIRMNENAAPDKRSFRVDFGLYQRLAPGHLPRCSIGDSIEGLRHGLACIGFKDDEFRSSRYMRLRVLTGLQKAGLLNESLEWSRAEVR